MAIVTKDELIEKIKARLGEDTSDEAIALLEDITDTIGDYEEKTKDNTLWENKYKENDEAWRQRYRNRFYGKEEQNDEDLGLKDEDEKPKQLSFDELFKEENKNA